MSQMNVFNPFLHDVTIKFSGRDYVFPARKTVIVTDQRFEAPDTYRRNLIDGSDEDKAAMHAMSIKAPEFIAALLKRHYVDYVDAGWVVSKDAITTLQMENAKIKANGWGRRLVDEMFQERRERQSGGMGRLAPDQQVVDWMIELGIHDEIINPKPVQPAIDEALIQRLGSAIGSSIVQVMENRKSPQ